MKNYIIFSILFALSYIVPKKKKLIICGAGDAKQFQGNPKYLLLYLMKNNERELEFYWSSKSKTQQDELRNLSIPFIDPYSLHGFWKILRAKYMFIEKSSFDVYYTKSIFGRFNFIQTTHGSPLKKVGIDAQGQNSSLPLASNQRSLLYKFLKTIHFFSRQKFKLILATSEEIKTINARAFENPKVAIVGYSRNDVLFHKDLALKNYQNEFNFKNYDRVTLYAPTFRDDSYTVKPFSDNLTIYNEKLKALNILLIIKKHPWQKTLQIPQDLSNILDLSEKVDDINELLPFIDVLVTDYSSVFFDFMLTRKPFIYFPYDLEDYIKNCRGLYYDYYSEFQGPFAFNEEDLFNLILTVNTWENEPEYVAKYEQVLSKFNQYVDGNSSERLLNLLYN